MQMYSGQLQDPEGGIPTQERMVGRAVQRVFTGTSSTGVQLMTCFQPILPLFRS